MNHINRPSTITIGGVKYKIIYKANDKCIELGDGVCGCIYHAAQEIYIATNVPKDLQDVSLLHEIIHGIQEVMGENRKEKYVRVFSHLLYACLKEINFRAR